MIISDCWTRIVPDCQMPDEADEVLITIEQDESYGKGTKISYEVTLGEYHKEQGYLESANGFFDTTDDWDEGQPIRVIAWMKKPTAYWKKGDTLVMGDICGDDRFVLIERAKKHLLDSTNIESSPDEMKVLDSFLFRCWQMGWLESERECGNGSK